MTTLLEQAFAEAAALDPADQDALAALILEELRSEQRWQRTLERSLPTLAQLAGEALEDYRSGKTRQLPGARK